MKKANRKTQILSAELNLEDKIICTNRVSKVVTGGRRFRFSAIVVVGNRDGIVGHGLGKANDVTNAQQKALDNAKKNLIRIPITKNGSIYHDIVGKSGSGRILLKPANEGTGVIAGSGVKIMLDLAGIQNVLCKSLRSSNSHNMIKAAFSALANLEDPITVARRRGISIDRVFNG